MFVRHMEQKGTVLVPIEDGAMVCLIEQTGDGKVIFADADAADDDEPESLPAAEFFQTHREATREEINEWAEDHPAEASDAADRMEAAADRAEKAADRAEAALAKAKEVTKEHAEAAAKSAKAADEALKDGKKAATDAAASATKAAAASTPPPA